MKIQPHCSEKLMTHFRGGVKSAARALDSIYVFSVSNIYLERTLLGCQSTLAYYPRAEILI
jgi:hypothetical protein